MSRILVPFDESAQATEALSYVLEEFDSAEIVLLHVADPINSMYAGQPTVPGYSEEWRKDAEGEAEQLFNEAEKLATEYGVELSKTATNVGRPAPTILEFAEENDIDHIVMGSHGRSGVSRVLLGSVAERVVRRASVPVTIVR